MAGEQMGDIAWIKAAEPRTRVLVVDDNIDAVHSMAVLMKMMGHEVQFAINGLGALAHLAKLCARAAKAVADLEARVLVRSIENLARLLCYADGHVGMEAGSLHGVDALKLQLFNALSALRGRLQFLRSIYIPSRP